MDENFFNEVLPILQSNLFISLIEERVSTEEYGKLCEKYQVDVEGSLFCCVVFHTSEQQLPEGVSYKQLASNVDRAIDDRVATRLKDNQLKCKKFIYIKNPVLIIYLDSPTQISQVFEICDSFCKWAYKTWEAVVTAGIGKICDSLYNINISYEGAKEAVSYSAVYGSGCAINIEERLKGMMKRNPKHLVIEAQNIVADKYMEPDLSLDTVCSALGVSNSYFSAIFKKETGKPFITYLTDYRLDIATGLLLDSDRKNYKIAEQVGYLDANYFSYVFKRRFGVSPSKYKEEHGLAI
jgi:YesN/AraC family two-component response regulator